MQVAIKRVRHDDNDFLCLVKTLSEMLAELNGEKNSYYAPLNVESSLAVALVAYVNDEAAGCGGSRPMDQETIEIKRMFVSPAQRGVGIGRAILAELESIGKQDGYEKARLETSKRLTIANRLYEKSGYAVIPNYGPYVGLDDSVCMEKLLS